MTHSVFSVFLLRGEQRKEEITGEVSFYACAVRDGFMKMGFGENRKRKRQKMKTDTQRR